MNKSLPACLASLVLAGCASALPHGSSDAPSAFSSYADARAGAEKILPFQTRPAELAALGFDIEGGRNVTVIPYPEIVARLVPYSGLPPEQLEPGVRACLQAQSACRGYLFKFNREDRKREGAFLADFLNFRRITNVTGWSFEALVVVTNESVVYRTIGGEPHVQRSDKQTNPLGPLQPAGEAAGALLVH